MSRGGEGGYDTEEGETWGAPSVVDGGSTAVQLPSPPLEFFRRFFTRGSVLKPRLSRDISWFVFFEVVVYVVESLDRLLFFCVVFVPPIASFSTGRGERERERKWCRLVGIHDWIFDDE